MLNVCDRNRKFYHSITKTRYVRNSITIIKYHESTVYKGDTAGSHAENFYSIMYILYCTYSSDEICESFESIVTPAMNDALTRGITENDGLTARFYQSYWCWDLLVLISSLKLGV